MSGKPLKDLQPAAASKPVKLELNNSGAWKSLGTFDAADQPHADLVMDAAMALVVTLHNGADARRCPTLRISTDDSLNAVLMYWTLDKGWVPKATT